MAETYRTSGGNLGVSRRGVLRAGAVAAGAGAAGSLSIWSKRSPIGSARAIAPVLAAAAGIAVGAYAGVRLYAEWSASGDEPDHTEENNDQWELETWNLVNALHVDSQPTRTDMMNVFRIDDTRADGDPIISPENDTSRADSTKFANTAWSEIRKATSRSLNEGRTTGEVVSDAQEAFDISMTTALLNSMSEWNAGVNALASSVAEAHNRGITDLLTTVYSNGNPGFDITTIDPSNHAGVEGVVFVDEAETQAAIVEVEIEFPVDLSKVEGYEQDTFKCRAIPFENTSSSTTELVAPYGPGWTLADGDPYEPASDMGTTDKAFGIADGRVDDFSARAALHPGLHYEAHHMIFTVNNSISDDIQTYVETVQDQIDAGEMTTEDILGPSDIVDGFDDAGEIPRVTAELAAAGFNVPKQLASGVQATVEHPGLPASDNQQTGWLYIDIDASAEPESLSLSAGDTLAAADYNAAYLVYYDANDETKATLLSGESDDLKIVEIHGQDSDGNDITSLDFENYTPSVPDPTSPEDLQATVEAVNELRRQIEEMREEESSSGGGGGWFDGEGKTLGIVALIAAGAAFLLGGQSGS